MYGLYPRKGTIAVGSDADIAIWNPDIEKTHRLLDDARRGRLHALRGHVYKGWPEIVLSRGRIVVEGGN
jgi:dihydropyrimidinase